MSSISREFTRTIDNITDEIRDELKKRSFEGALVLQKHAKLVLQGQRHGRRYKVPGTYAAQKDKTDNKVKNGRYYTASAPGEPPAVRTGTFRNSWQPTSREVFGSYISRIESDIKTDGGGYLLGQILEEGTVKMEPRPYQEQILDAAEPEIIEIYDRPFF